jgi:hypothetical protein
MSSDNFFKSESMETLKTLFGAFQALTNEVLSAGWPEKSLVVIEEDAQLRSRLSELIIESLEKKWGHSHFSPCPNDVESFFNPLNWPLEPEEPDEKDWKVDSYYFSEDFTGYECIKRLEKLAKDGEIRLCGVRRFLSEARFREGQVPAPIRFGGRDLIPYRWEWNDIDIYNEKDGDDWQPCVAVASLARIFSKSRPWFVLKKKQAVV